MNRRLSFLNRNNSKHVARTWVPPVSGASVDDDEDPKKDENEDENPEGEGNDPKKPETVKVVFTPEQQAYIDSVMANVRKEGRAAGKKEATEAATKKQMEEKEEFKTLYENTNKELGEIKPKYEELQSTVEAQEKAILDFIDPMLDELPELTRTLIQKQSPLEQLQMLQEHAGDLVSGSVQQRRVPASKTGKRKEETQPLAKGHVTSTRKRIAERVSGSGNNNRG